MRSINTAVTDALSLIVHAHDVAMSGYNLSKTFDTVNIEFLLDKLYIEGAER